MNLARGELGWAPFLEASGPTASVLLFWGWVEATYVVEAGAKDTCAARAGAKGNALQTAPLQTLTSHQASKVPWLFGSAGWGEACPLIFSQGLGMQLNAHLVCVEPWGLTHFSLIPRPGVSGVCEEGLSLTQEVPMTHRPERERKVFLCLFPQCISCNKHTHGAL